MITKKLAKTTIAKVMEKSLSCDIAIGKAAPMTPRQKDLIQLLADVCLAWHYSSSNSDNNTDENIYLYEKHGSILRELGIYE